MILLDKFGVPIDQTWPIGPPTGPVASPTPFPPYFEASMTITEFNVYYSPSGGARAAFIAAIEAASLSIRIMTREITDIGIALALKNAAAAGVAVLVIFDAGRTRYQASDAHFLKDAGCEVYIDNSHRVVTRNVALIDAETLCIGSFSYTAGADAANAEELLIFKPDASLITSMGDNLEVHRAHAILL